ncbi:TIGR00269 family protein [Desulfonatronospira sp.]|uniref:TIGR00269 family protein n=1 Tax=Desulfonatronospira sp. TaxID=1962951 RepID=UPI0025C1F17F|nr:TIGR00269 family protein [Desulfonatronospira sp.]
MKCTRCKKTAAVALPRHNAGFCPECYGVFFSRQVEKAIKERELFSKEDKILIALSGGKDSLALARELQLLGYNIAGLHIDLAIPGSSVKARGHVERFCSDFGVDLHVLEMENEGMPIPEVRKKFNRPVCSVCGRIKRYYFNRFAMDNGFNVLATGHNLDDEAARLFSNVMRWDAAYLGAQGPDLPGDQGFVRKVKPLYRVSEFETANYSFLAKIDYCYAPCPYSKGASFTFYKSLLDELENEQPGRKLSFYEGFLNRGRQAFARIDQEDGEKLCPCPRCGYPTTGEICGICRIREIMHH